MKKDIFKQLKQEYENEMQFKDSLSDVKGRLSFRENKKKRLPLGVLVPVSTLLVATAASVCAVVVSISVNDNLNGGAENTKANEATENAAPALSSDMVTTSAESESLSESL